VHRNELTHTAVLKETFTSSTSPGRKQKLSGAPLAAGVAKAQPVAASGTQ
jgi:hypothetical protein